METIIWHCLTRNEFARLSVSVWVTGRPRGSAYLTVRDAGQGGVDATLAVVPLSDAAPEIVERITVMGRAENEAISSPASVAYRLDRVLGWSAAILLNRRMAARDVGTQNVRVEDDRATVVITD